MVVEPVAAEPLAAEPLVAGVPPVAPEPLVEAAQLHAADRIRFARGVPRGFALIADRGTEIVTAAAYSPREELFIDHPVGESFFNAADDSGAVRTKFRSEIFVAERDRTFLDMAVGVNDTHV